MDKQKLRKAYSDWADDNDFKYFTTLNFNYHGYYSLYSVNRSLKGLHARLDEKALGAKWCEKPISQRLNSMSFLENKDRNMHFHMLWTAPIHEAKLLEELPNIWEKLVPGGQAVTKDIFSPSGASWYSTKQGNFEDCVLSSYFFPQ